MGARDVLAMLKEAFKASAAADAPPSPTDAGRTVRPKAPAPVRPAGSPPPAAVGRGLAISAVLLLIGRLGRKK